VDEPIQREWAFSPCSSDGVSDGGGRVVVIGRLGGGCVSAGLWETVPITSWKFRLALAADRAPIAANSVKCAIVTFLAESWVPMSITPSSRSGTTADDIWKIHCSVSECLGAIANDAFSNGKRLETVNTNGRVNGECLMDTAAPVRQGGIIKCSKGGRRRDNVSHVVAIQVSSDTKFSKVG
jgi:hypothetical protein